MNGKTADPFLEPLNCCIDTVALEELNDIGDKYQHNTDSLAP
jgi:hypothetical protein